jgi:hypothetical protein
MSSSREIFSGLKNFPIECFYRDPNSPPRDQNVEFTQTLALYIIEVMFYWHKRLFVK